MPEREQQWRPFVRMDVAVSLFIAAMTGGGIILGWAEGVPWTVRIPAILLTLCACLYFWDRAGSRIRAFFGFHGTRNESDEDAESNFLLSLGGGKIERRAEVEEGPKGKFYTLKCHIHNPTKKTLSGIKVILYSRSWQKGSVLATYKDSKPHFMKFDDGPLSLDPKMTVEIIFLSQNVDDQSIIYLGDHKDQDVTRLECDGKNSDPHFITIGISAADTVPCFKNLVVLTLPNLAPVPLEYDSRRWGDPNKSPSPFVNQTVPQQ